MAERSDLYHDARVQKEAESLRKNGFDVVVIGLRANKLNLDNEFSYRMKTYHVLPRNYGYLRKLHLLFLILYINIKIIFIKSDFYHSHNTFFLPGMYIAKKLFRGKLVYDSHEVQWELNLVASIQERLFINKVDKIINVSKGRAKAQSERFNISLKNIHVISNYPVLVEEIINKPSLNRGNSVRFIFSGGLNLSDNKIDNFIRAIKDYPEVTIDFLAFGYSNSALVIKNIIAELGIENRVKFLPLVKPNEVLETITNYDYTVNMMVNPQNLVSINYHSINKIYEAISAGLPILCSNLPAFIEEIVNNEIGYNVDPESIESIQEGIKRIIHNKSNHLIMRRKAFDLAKAKFNWSLEETKLINLYNSL